MKTIVVSAVNLRVGGTLTILRECLEYLSDMSAKEKYRIVALVYDKNLAYYPNIEYIEMKWPKKTWTGRLWCEYVTMRKISKQLAPVYLWLSLHDTTPNVIAERRAVYCHNPFPFYKWKWREWFFTPKIVLFALFTKWIYRINIYNNNHVVVQQQWIKDAFLKWFRIQSDNLIVAPPTHEKNTIPIRAEKSSECETLCDKSSSPPKSPYVFFFPSMANSHKNFECVCAAANILTERIGRGHFELCITIKGDENGYARWLYRKWSGNPAIRFAGFLSRAELYSQYERSDCLIFPSKIETWGLPITEFSVYNKPMLLADLPYARETASGCNFISFINPDDPDQLARRMEELIRGDYQQLKPAERISIKPPVANSWQELFSYLLN